MTTITLVVDIVTIIGNGKAVTMSKFLVGLPFFRLQENGFVGWRRRIEMMLFRALQLTKGSIRLCCLYARLYCIGLDTG